MGPPYKKHMETVQNPVREFGSFLREFNVYAFAITFVMGNAVTTLINSFVKDVVMPFVSPFTTGGSWQTAVWNVGPFAVAYGPFLANLLNFLVVGLVVFLVMRKLLQVAPPEKK